MMNAAHFRNFLLSLLVAGMLATSSVTALEEATHRLVNQFAVLAASPFDFEAHLRTSLGLKDGTDTVVPQLFGPSRTVREWIEGGGEWEDMGSPVPGSGRFFHHFHDPLQPWNSAGLNFMLQTHQSSIRWMQNRDQGSGATGGKWSWHDARRMYYQALTHPDRRQRDELLAGTFRAVGQMMHLVVDASNPAHARDAAHWQASADPTGRFFWNYDKWILRRHTAQAGREFVLNLLADPIGFDPELLKIAIDPDEPASVPIARLIDSDRYKTESLDPSVTYNASNPRAPVAIGLAEISNANFFSEYSLNNRKYAYPPLDGSGLVRTELLSPVPTPSGLDLVTEYWKRPAGSAGLPVDPLRAGCASDSVALDVPIERKPKPCMDGRVWDETATHMLPRAVGYARGVLEYFFRGKMAVTKVEWSDWREGLEVTVKNTGDEEMEGVFEIYARHNPGTHTERRVKIATLSDGAAITLAPSQQRSFDTQFSTPADWTATSAMVLVFKGRLGLEQDAVAGQVFTVPWVEVKQTSYAANVTKTCVTPEVREHPRLTQGTFPRRSQFARCDWYPSSHHVLGTIATNNPIDPATGQPQRVIQRIEATWYRGTGGPVPLSIDGGPPSSVWQRQGNEPDPKTFEILDPTFRGTRAFLGLSVTYTGGPVLEVQLATFGLVRASHSKSLWETAEIEPYDYLVMSTRGMDASLDYNWSSPGSMDFPFFEAITIGGVPVPTDTTGTPTEFHSLRSNPGLQTFPFFYTDSVDDHFEIFSDGDAASNLFEAVTLVVPNPGGPRFNWTATLVRSFHAKEREFHRLFVADTVLPHEIQMLGHPTGE